MYVSMYEKRELSHWEIKCMLVTFTEFRHKVQYKCNHKENVVSIIIINYCDEFWCSGSLSNLLLALVGKQIIPKPKYS